MTHHYSIVILVVFPWDQIARPFMLGSLCACNLTYLSYSAVKLFSKYYSILTYVITVGYTWTTRTDWRTDGQTTYCSTVFENTCASTQKYV